MGQLKENQYSIVLHGSELLKLNRSLHRKSCARYLFAGAFTVAGTSDNTRVAAEQSFLGKLLKRTATFPCAIPEWLKESGCEEERAEEPIRVLCMARIHPRKGQMEVAKALTGLSTELKKRVLFVLAGKDFGNYLPPILALCRDNDVAVEVKGEVSRCELARLYSTSHIYAMTSRRTHNSVEGFGITYLEAGYFGLPVVAYETGGVSEAIRHEKTGFLLPEGNIEELTGALEQLIESKELRERMGREGHHFALEFSWDRTARIFKNTFEDIVSSP